MKKPTRLPHLPFKSRAGLTVQREISRLLGVVWIPAVAFVMRFMLFYRIQDARRVRRRFRRLVNEVDGPLLICPNHLTMVDSALVAWALGGSWWYVFNYSRMPWNLPEYHNFAANWANRAVVWVAKCIPIVRGGAREDVAKVLSKVQHVLSRKETAMMFAEGGRSRTGRVDVDSAAHGVGRIASSITGCKTLCVYMRGKKQKSWSTIPALGDSFYVDFKFIEPTSENSGMRRSRDFARQITESLAEMELRYFALQGS